MYKYRKFQNSIIYSPCNTEGEHIETKVRRLIENKEPIKDGSPIIYTERKDGVNAAYNIRTDRFELATDAMDRIHRSKIAKREEIMKLKADSSKNLVDPGKENINKVEPIAGKS